VHAEIVVTAVRPSDQATSAQVTTALQQDPYIFSDHVTVTTKNGVVRLEGMVHDLSDLHAILRLARRIAGKGRVVNGIEYVPVDDDGN
jgi:osmotically-inducible protein OsmY